MGAGLIGRRHIQHVCAEPEAELIAVVDPSEAGREVAAQSGAPWYASLRDLLATGRPDGVVDSAAAAAATVPRSATSRSTRRRRTSM